MDVTEIYFIRSVSTLYNILHLLLNLNEHAYLKIKIDNFTFPFPNS